MTRSPNKTTTRLPPGIGIKFQPHEYRFLKINRPGPSGTMGGMQDQENWLKQNTNPDTLECWLPPERLSRTINYIRKMGPGGPNGSIRAACTPALRRAGVDPLPEWRAP